MAGDLQKFIFYRKKCHYVQQIITTIVFREQNLESLLLLIYIQGRILAHVHVCTRGVVK